MKCDRIQYDNFRNIESAELDLGGGKTLRITAHDQSEKNIYVSSVTLNGVPVEGFTLRHADIADGGELVFTMTDKPCGICLN